MAAYISFQPSDFFNTVLYTGTAAENVITGVGFSSDFTWVKRRNSSGAHYAFDTARGATKAIIPNDTDVEDTNAEFLKSWESDGFTLGTSGGPNGSYTYASWNWLGGTTSGITTNGSTTITPSAYSFNQTSGFSVLAYSGNSTSGAKVAHGLGATPAMVMVKSLGSANNWSVYHKNSNAVPEDYTLQLDTTAAAADNAGMWNDTAPDSVNLTLGNDNGVNGGYDYVAYCFAEKSGFSKFGVYEGNGNADGPFIYTGFRPAFVIIKISSGSGTGNWYMFDNKRAGYNVENEQLYCDTTGSTDSDDIIDLVSNGFKIRGTEFGINADGKTIIYMAFAEFPIVSSNSKATVAR